VFEDLRVDVARPIGFVVRNLDLRTVGTFSGLRRPLLKASITLDLLVEMQHLVNLWKVEIASISMVFNHFVIYVFIP